MNISVGVDERVKSVEISAEELSVALMDGRRIVVPIAWFPRLSGATPEQRQNWEICAGGFGLHWPDIDEDLSTAGLLRGAHATQTTASTG